MRVACCQLDIAWEDKPANYRKVEALVGAAGLPPGTLLLLPEMFATGFTMNAAAVAEAIDGPTAAFLSDLARRHGIFIQAGAVIRQTCDERVDDSVPSTGTPGEGRVRVQSQQALSVTQSFGSEPSPGLRPTSRGGGVPGEVKAEPPIPSGTRDDRPRNEALAFDPDGRLLAHYAKMHLFSFAGEHEPYAPGDSTVAFGWHDAIVAPAICYDLRFPELFRQAVKDQAQVLSIIACWPAPREEHWLTLLRARAIENQCSVAAVNRCGRDPSGLAYAGRSQIIDPRGAVLADGGKHECIIQADVDLEAQKQYRQKFPALRDMRM